MPLFEFNLRRVYTYRLYIVLIMCKSLIFLIHKSVKSTRLIWFIWLIDCYRKCQFTYNEYIWHSGTRHKQIYCRASKDTRVCTQKSNKHLCTYSYLFLYKTNLIYTYTSELLFLPFLMAFKTVYYFTLLYYAYYTSPFKLL